MYGKFPEWLFSPLPPYKKLVHNRADELQLVSEGWRDFPFTIAEQDKAAQAAAIMDEVPERPVIEAPVGAITEPVVERHKAPTDADWARLEQADPVVPTQADPVVPSAPTPVGPESRLAKAMKRSKKKAAEELI
jgi:hypothetical protein